MRIRVLTVDFLKWNFSSRVSTEKLISILSVLHITINSVSKLQNFKI